MPQAQGFDMVLRPQGTQLRVFPTFICYDFCQVFDFEGEEGGGRL